MLACKETAVLHFVGLGAAGLWWWFAARRAGAISNSSQNVCASLAMAGAAALGVFLFVLVGFYTWGGTRWQGLWDLFQAIPHLASRASGEGHEKPAWYYFTLLAGGWSGWPVLILALAGAASSVFKFTDNKTTEPRVSDNNPSGRQRRMFQTLLVYTLVIWVLYSAIPYKTPWLALNLWLPLSLWAGCGFAALWQKARPAAASASTMRSSKAGGMLNEYAVGGPIWGMPRRLKSSRSSAFASQISCNNARSDRIVAVPVMRTWS
jgi:predicted membrane-bound mannosyltransferase